MQYLILILCLTIVPILNGMIFFEHEKGRLISLIHNYVLGIILELVIFSCVVWSTKGILRNLNRVYWSYWGGLFLLALFSLIKNRKWLMLLIKRRWQYPTKRSCIYLICAVVLVGYQIFMCRQNIWYSENEQLITMVNHLNDSPSGLALWYGSLTTITGMRMHRLMELVFPAIWLMIHYFLMYSIGVRLFDGSYEKGLGFTCATAVWNIFGVGYRWLPCSYLIYQPGTGEGILAALLIPFFFSILLEKISKENIWKRLVEIFGLGMAMHFVSNYGMVIWKTIILFVLIAILFNRVKSYVKKSSVYNKYF